MAERILVVDDEPDLQLLIAQKFRKQIRENVYAFVFAENGDQALARLQENPDIGLMLTDINMPVMDGLTLLQRLSALDRIIKSVVVSAYGDMEKIRIAMNRGAFDFITKPIDLEDLERTVEKARSEISFIRSAIEARESLEQEKAEKENALHREKIKQQFLANMSHEIRTPINAIYGMSQLMLNKLRDEEDRIYLDAIKRSSENLIVIINDILDLSKIEAGKMEFESIPFSPVECIELVRTTLQFKAQEKGLHLHLHVAPEVPPILMGDPTRLNQILINLAGNAIKFTEKGSVTISCSGESTTTDGKQVFHLTCAVKDTGIGMTEEQLAKLFQSFTQVSSDTARKYGGTGLGLVLSRQFVEMQQGNITVSSTYGEGTTFSFTIPYPVGEEAAIPGGPAPLSLEEIEKINNLRILLAEDNLFNQMVAEGLIHSVAERTEIDIADNGRAALEQLNRTRYDIVLMDVHMPEMDGLEATGIIRQTEALKNIPVIAMTAVSTREEIQECFDAGMNDYVPKPFDITSLLRKIISLTVE